MDKERNGGKRGGKDLNQAATKVRGKSCCQESVKLVATDLFLFVASNQNSIKK